MLAYVERSYKIRCWKKDQKESVNQIWHKKNIYLCCVDKKVTYSWAIGGRIRHFSGMDERRWNVRRTGRNGKGDGQLHWHLPPLPSTTLDNCQDFPHLQKTSKINNHKYPLFRPKPNYFMHKNQLIKTSKIKPNLINWLKNKMKLKQKKEINWN